MKRAKPADASFSSGDRHSDGHAFDECGLICWSETDGEAGVTRRARQVADATEKQCRGTWLTAVDRQVIFPVVPKPDSV